MSDMDVEAFKFAISQPGALTAALNYYRNVGTLYLEDDWLKDGQARITSPTLIVWVRCYKMSVIAFVEFTGGGGGGALFHHSSYFRRTILCLYE